MRLYRQTHASEKKRSKKVRKALKKRNNVWLDKKEKLNRRSITERKAKDSEQSQWSWRTIQKKKRQQWGSLHNGRKSDADIQVKEIKKENIMKRKRSLEKYEFQH